MQFNGPTAAVVPTIASTALPPLARAALDTLLDLCKHARNLTFRYTLTPICRLDINQTIAPAVAGLVIQMPILLADNPGDASFCPYCLVAHAYLNLFRYCRSRRYASCPASR